nr:hypothetical protein L204_01795 [Cryptococcus depauperatus CBS 7855]
MGASDHHHRSTLKQVNKKSSHKHASKGSDLVDGIAGKISKEGVSHAKKTANSLSKGDRLNAAAQKKRLQHKSGTEDAKLFSVARSGGHVPRIVTLVPLASSLLPAIFLSRLLLSFGLSDLDYDEACSSLSNCGTYLFQVPRFQTSLQVNILPYKSLYSTLDAVLVSDYVIPLMSSVDEVDNEGETVLRCLQGQIGNAEVVACVQSPQSDSNQKNSLHPIRKSLLSFIKYFFPSVNKVYSSDTPNDSILLARALCEAVPRHNKGINSHAYLVAETHNMVTWTSEEGDKEDAKGLLEVVGIIRGGGRFSADRLVHIPGSGDYQLDAILPAPRTSNDAALLEGSSPLSLPTDNADDLTATQTGSETFVNKQVMQVDSLMSDSISKRGVMVESDENDIALDSSNSHSDSSDLDHEELDHELVDDTQLQDNTLGVSEEKENQISDVKPCNEDAVEQYTLFPDEVDTPQHIPARTRFQRYRGLKSFRTSPWDPYDDLPTDYARIFRFENYLATKKEVEHEALYDGVESGTRVKLVIRNVPRAVARLRDAHLPLIVHSLLRHEHKQSVLHFVVQRNTEYSNPVMAKKQLILCVGPRRFSVNPLYSQHVGGQVKGANDVHKSEKFLKSSTAAVLTTFAPIWFGKKSCLVLKDGGTSSVPSLVATGSFLSPDPSRIIAKRIVLTGHPVQIHKKTATIRNMFFNCEDIEYFKSIELYTKYGRTGHIQESLGTHGHYKAHFDGPLQQMDTICMSLYKRQFPKWASYYQSLSTSEENEQSQGMMIDDSD